MTNTTDTILDLDSVLDAAVANAHQADATAPAVSYSMNDAVEALPAQAPVFLPQVQPAAATYTPAPTLSAFEDDDEDGLSVEKWLKPTPGGVVVDKTPMEELLVVLSLTESGVKKFRAITYGPEKESKRAKTYGKGPLAVVDQGDGKGRNWLEFCQHVQSLWPDCKGDFPSADLTFRTVNDITHKLGNIPAGTYVGHTASKTSWKAVDILIKKAKNAKLVGQDVLVKVSGQQNSYNGVEWNTITLELVGPADTE